MFQCTVSVVSTPGNETKTRQVKLDQVKSRQVKTRQVKSGQVKSGQDKWSQVRPSQVKYIAESNRIELIRMESEWNWFVLYCSDPNWIEWNKVTTVDLSNWIDQKYRTERWKVFILGSWILILDFRRERHGQEQSHQQSQSNTPMKYYLNKIKTIKINSYPKPLHNTRTE